MLEAKCLQLAQPGVAQEELTTYEARLDHLENCHSRSWFGDHSSTYYDQLISPPAGRTFDVEWGFIPGYSGSRNPGWKIYTRQELRNYIFEDIGQSVFDATHQLATELHDEFEIVRDQSLDVLHELAGVKSSAPLLRYIKRLEEELVPYSIADYVNSRLHGAPRMTRDSEEIAKGQIVPIHVQYKAALASAENNRTKLQRVAVLIRNVIQLQTLDQTADSQVAKSNIIFIGHGRSEQWRALKDFLRDRLSLEYEEFNRVSPAGISTQERLTEMLDLCGFAFLVMTSEDEHHDGSMHARENVIHEAGLFQGKLGLRKAIILLEDGCKEFSNIVGLGQIRFSKANISSCFEEIRRVLERERLIGS